MAEILKSNVDGGGAKPKTNFQLSKHSQAAHKPKKKVKFKDFSTISAGLPTDDKHKIQTEGSDANLMTEAERFTGNVYSKPEFHSTLLLAEKLQSLRFDTFNEEEAVCRKLEQCDKTRKMIVHKSVKRLNIPPAVTIYKDMIPLEFDENSLLRTAAEEKAAKWKQVMPKSRPKDPEPQIEEFLTPDNQPEFFTMPAPQFRFPHLLAPVVPKTRNTLYLHRRKWENLP